MALFESYDRRIDHINAVLNEYGINGIEDAKAICDAKGIDPYTMCKETQPICFENACWAYVVGAAIAIKKGCTNAAEAAEAAAADAQSAAEEARNAAEQSNREAAAYAVAMANRAVAERAEAEAALANMGTTLVAAVAYENGAVITNVGDSRAYYITEAGIDIDLFIIVEYGISIVEVCNIIKSQVCYKIENMTGAKVRRVNISVEGIRV